MPGPIQVLSGPTSLILPCHLYRQEHCDPCFAGAQGNVPGIPLSCWKVVESERWGCSSVVEPWPSMHAGPEIDFLAVQKKKIGQSELEPRSVFLILCLKVMECPLKYILILVCGR